MIKGKMFTGLAAVILLVGCNTTAPAEGNSGAQAEPDTDQAQPEVEVAQQETGEEQPDDTEDEKVTSQTEEAAATQDIKEFDLELEFFNGDEWDYDYERGDLDDTKIERSGQNSVEGRDAADEIEALLGQVDINPNSPIGEVKTQILNTIGTAAGDVEDFEMDIEFASGEKMEIDHDTTRSGSQGAVREFDLDIEFISGEDLEYDFERDDREAEIERRDGSEVEGSAAFEEIEALLNDITITMDRSIEEMKAEVFASIGIDESEVEEIDLEIKYENGEEIKFKHDLELNK